MRQYFRWHPLDIVEIYHRHCLYYTFKELIRAAMKYVKSSLLLFLILFFPHFLQGALLKERLKQGAPGDYIVTAIDHTYTVLLIRDKSDERMAFEEITIPSQRIPKPWQGWRNWVENGAPGHTSWVLYPIQLPAGEMGQTYSYSQRAWCQSGADNFLSTLLNLNMKRIPKKDRRRVGAGDTGRPWVPQVTYEGQVVQDVVFEAWRTYWPKDGGDLSGKALTVYLPKDDKRYPAYFPYWLEIHGMIGKAKIRIIDSGRNLTSPAEMR